MLDISGLAEIPETPSRPLTAASPSSLRVLRRPPVEGEYISVTDSSGNRVYLRRKEDTETKVKGCTVVPLRLMCTSFSCKRLQNPNLQKHICAVNVQVMSVHVFCIVVYFCRSQTPDSHQTPMVLWGSWQCQ